MKIITLHCGYRTCHCHQVKRKVLFSKRCVLILFLSTALVEVQNQLLFKPVDLRFIEVFVTAFDHSYYSWNGLFLCKGFIKLLCAMHELLNDGWWLQIRLRYFTWMVTISRNDIFVSVFKVSCTRESKIGLLLLFNYQYTKAY